MKIFSTHVSHWSEAAGAYLTDLDNSIYFNYNGEIDLCCGASSQQTAIGDAQTSAYKTMTNQAQQVFGNSSQVFTDLTNSFAPTVAAGPDQEGFSPTEKAALNSQAITSTGQAYKNAKSAVGNAQAGLNGGNAQTSGGSTVGTDVGLAENAGNQTSSELNQITQADYAAGKANYDTAAKGLEGATGVFDPVAGMDNAATSGGNSAAKTANDISTQNNSWVGAVTGALGQIGGAAVSGFTGGLGKSKAAPAASGGSGGSYDSGD